MEYELKRIRIWSAVKIGFVVWGALGFLGGLYMALMMPVMLKLLGSLAPIDEGAGLVGPVAFVVFPAVYALMGAVGGTIMTVIVAGLYNLLATVVGGVELEFSDQTLRPLDLARMSTPSGPSSEADQSA